MGGPNKLLADANGQPLVVYAVKAALASQAVEVVVVLGHMADLASLETGSVEPTAHAFPLFNVWREDVPAAALPVAAALQNAPVQRQHMVSVPQVVE